MTKYFSCPPTVVWRHRKENLKKCSLRGLEERSDFQFYRYPGALPDLTGYVLLTLNAPTLSPQEAERGLFVIDATWRYALAMEKKANEIPFLIKRSLPEQYRTAYPRCQTECPDPVRGLASIEAIYVAY